MVRRIARTAGKTVTLPADLRRSLTLTLKEVHWRAALRSVAEALRLHLVRDARGAYRLTAKQAFYGRKLVRKYRRQLPEELLEVALGDV